MDHSNEITAQSAPNTNVNTPTMNPLAEKHSLDSDATRSMTNTSFADEKAMNNGNHYKNNGDVREPTIPEEDEFAQDVFTAHADGNDDHVDFRTMGWVQAGFVCLAEAIALGLLSFPSIFQRLGLVGGLIATILLACLAYITAWIYIDFKLRYMGCMNVADAGTIMFGRIGGIIFGVGIMVKSIGLAASHALAGEIALSNISDNAVCKIVFTVVICIVSVLLSLQRHFGKLTPMSIISVTCITVASFITIIGTGVQSPSVLVKNNVPIEWKVINYDATLSDVIGAMTNICFTFGTNMAVLTFCSEMKAPKDFRKSFVIVQGLQLFLYSLVGSLVYVFGGQYTTSPALTMTTRPLAITAYSFALVTIIISGVVAVNIGAKYFYVTQLRGTRLLTSGGWKAQFIWVGIVCGMWILGFIFAELIPFFNQLLTIISSLVSTWSAYGVPGIIWFFMRKPQVKADGWRQAYFGSLLSTFFFFCSAISIVLSVAFTPLGIYSAVQGDRKSVV